MEVIEHEDRVTNDVLDERATGPEYTTVAVGAGSGSGTAAGDRTSTDPFRPSRSERLNGSRE
jgi:hypothetical protein